MSRSMLERRLTDVAHRLKQLGEDLRIADEQLRHFVDEAEDARLRATVSEAPVAQREQREAQRHADAMARHRQDLTAEIARLERTQDELLDRLLETMDPPSMDRAVDQP
jgi:chromosome segregation ATPase